MSCVCHVQSTRERLRLTQAELARRAGLSRQVVNMVERGRILPSVTTALALAEALGCEVTDIFQKPSLQQPLEVRITPAVSHEQGPVRLGQVGERWVAFPGVAAESSGFGEADGQLLSREGNTGLVRPLRSESQLSQNLLVLGSDPALGIVRDLWKRNNLEGSVRWQNVSCREALDGLTRGETHVAGVCFPDADSELRALFGLGVEITIARFARWELGWMVKPGNPLKFRSVCDLAHGRARFMDQTEGSIAAMMIENLMIKEGATFVRSEAAVAANPFECAGAIRQGTADVAIGMRAVAESFNLDFLPIKEVSFDLVIPRQFANTAPVLRLLGLLQNADFRSQLASLPGYVTDETGKRLAFSSLA